MALAIVCMVCIDLYCNCLLLASLKPQPFLIPFIAIPLLSWASHSAWHTVSTNECWQISVCAPKSMGKSTTPALSSPRQEELRLCQLFPGSCFSNGINECGGDVGGWRKAGWAWSTLGEVLTLGCALGSQGSCNRHWACPSRAL